MRMTIQFPFFQCCLLHSVIYYTIFPPVTKILRRPVQGECCPWEVAPSLAPHIYKYIIHGDGGGNIITKMQNVLYIKVEPQTPNVHTHSLIVHEAIWDNGHSVQNTHVQFSGDNSYDHKKCCHHANIPSYVIHAHILYAL